MRYLKSYKLFEDKITTKEIEAELDELCESELAFIVDKGFEYYVTEDDNNSIIEITKKMDEDADEDYDADELPEFNWKELKEEFLQFISMVNEKYNIHEILFNQGDYYSSEHTVDELLSDDFGRKGISSIQVFIKSKK